MVGESIAVRIYFHVALVFLANQIFNISLQHLCTFVEFDVSVASRSVVGTPSKSPMIFQ